MCLCSHRLLLRRFEPQAWKWFSCGILPIFVTQDIPASPWFCSAPLSPIGLSLLVWAAVGQPPTLNHTVTRTYARGSEHGAREQTSLGREKLGQSCQGPTRQTCESQLIRGTTDRAPGYWTGRAHCGGGICREYGAVPASCCAEAVPRGGGAVRHSRQIVDGVE